MSSIGGGTRSTKVTAVKRATASSNPPGQIDLEWWLKQQGAAGAREGSPIRLLSLGLSASEYAALVYSGRY